MGYFYKGNQLCCDGCLKAGGVRKRRCTYGWCPPPALCAACWTKEGPRLRAYHREHCKALAEQSAHDQRIDDYHLAIGKWLLCSAYGPANYVAVMFRNAADDTRCVFIPGAIYRQRTAGPTWTLDQFEELHGGPFKEVPAEFQATRHTPAEIDAEAAL